MKKLKIKAKSFAFCLIILILACSLPALAQKKKKQADTEEEKVDERISTRIGEESEQENKKTKSSRTKSATKVQKVGKKQTSVKAIKPTNQFVEKKTWKRQIAYEEAREDPAYNDATYFGHKKKPKKRPPGKRKLCKECKMVH